MRQMMEKEGVTEQLKAQDMMDWVRKINNIRSRVREFVYEDIIYSLNTLCRAQFERNSAFLKTRH